MIDVYYCAQTTVGVWKIVIVGWSPNSYSWLFNSVLSPLNGRGEAKMRRDTTAKQQNNRTHQRQLQRTTNAHQSKKWEKKREKNSQERCTRHGNRKVTHPKLHLEQIERYRTLNHLAKKGYTIDIMRALNALCLFSFFSYSLSRVITIEDFGGKTPTVIKYEI